jgi:hypothetical protein
MSTSPVNPKLDASELLIFGKMQGPNTPEVGDDNFSLLPDDLKNLPNWVLWRYENRNGERTKVPYAALTGERAKSNDPKTWTTFSCVTAAFDRGGYDGLGIEFGTAVVGVDFDGVVSNGNPNPFVKDILNHLGNPYSEFSPSGEGLHALIAATKLPKGKRRFGTKKFGAEIYSGTEGGRYFTVTGNHFTESGTTIPRVEDIGLAYLLISQLDDKKETKAFRALWMGDTSDQGGDSKADFALMMHLARLTRGDAGRMESFFGSSKLAERNKWRDRQDYRERTVARALEEYARHSKANRNDEAQTVDLEFHLPAIMGAIDDFVAAPTEGQFDGWFPLGSPSLIGGASGSAKTTWMMQLLLSQRNGEMVLGHATCRRPFLVLMADRGEASHKRTMRRMGLENENIPIRFFTPGTGVAILQVIVDLIEGTSPLPQVVFIEGADFLVEDGNNKHDVTPFMCALQKIATRYHLAVICSVGSPKSKAGQGYIAKRDNISGTEAWARMAETVALLQYPKGEDTASERDLTVLPRNAASESFAMIFKQGRLLLQTEEDRRRAEGNDRELDWVREQARLAKTNPAKKWWTRLDMRQGLILSKTTVHDWTEHACDKGWIIQKPGKKGRGKKGSCTAGQFAWNESRTNPLSVVEPEEPIFPTTDILIGG